ncbi:MAG: alpha/beta fold hydrolase [Pseudomonadales bacterium]
MTLKNNSKLQIHTESMMVTVSAGPQLHMKRFCADKVNPGTPVFMVHGLAEDGHIFYSGRGKGLAPYLAAEGYDVYVADMRGSGKSWPSVSPKSTHGQHQAINEDIPALLRAIVRKRGPIPQIWISHGWGGVITSSNFARYGDAHAPVQAMVYFGSRRLVLDNGWRKNFALKVLWKTGLSLASRVTGYVPTRRFKIGTTNETRKNFSDALRWMFTEPWLDPEDEFDYQLSAKMRRFPASLYLACASDTVYGCPDDVRHFIAGLGEHNGQLIVLGKSGGSLQDYGHIGMLSAVEAEADHFPALLDWLDTQADNRKSFGDEMTPNRPPEALEA